MVLRNSRTLDFTGLRAIGALSLCPQGIKGALTHHLANGQVVVSRPLVGTGAPAEGSDDAASRHRPHSRQLCPQQKTYHRPGVAMFRHGSPCPADCHRKYAAGMFAISCGRTRDKETNGGIFI